MLIIIAIIILSSAPSLLPSIIVTVVVFIDALVVVIVFICYVIFLIIIIIIAVFPFKCVNDVRIITFMPFMQHIFLGNSYTMYKYSIPLIHLYISNNVAFTSKEYVNLFSDNYDSSLKT